MDINILDLHFDVLTLICEQIETLQDKKNFARSHPKLWNAVAYQCRHHVQSVIDFEKDEKRDINIHWDFILELCGSNITTIYNVYNYVDSGDLMEIVAKFCPNLEFIQFAIKKDNIKKVEENLPKLRQLRNIHMRINLFRLEKNDFIKINFSIANLIELMQRLTNLRHLSFGDHSLKMEERKQLNKLIQLEKLKIGPIEVDDVADLSTLLGHLRELIIVYYPDTKTLRRLAKHCINLETLSLEDRNNISFYTTFSSKWRIAYFPKLTNLHIFKGSCHNPFLCHLDSRYDDQLQVLNIPCITIGAKEIARIANLRVLKELFCSKILPSSIDVLIRMKLEHINYWESKPLNKFHILRLIRECSSLKVLRCNCHGIDKEFLSEVLDILKAKGFQPDRPFELSNVTYINHEINKELMIQFALMPNSNLTKLQLK